MILFREKNQKKTEANKLRLIGQIEIHLKIISVVR